MTEPLRLHANENLLGPSPMAVAAMQEACLNANFYPQNHEAILLEKLAAHIGHGIRPEQFVLGNGSADVLRMLVQHHGLPDAEIVVPRPTFVAYKRLTRVHRANLVEVPLIDYQIDFDGLINAITDKTTLLFLCNPNNPTGLYVNHQEMADFLARVPEHVCVVVDEAYHDFVDVNDFPRMMEFVNAGYNVIVARTFSKVYGLASMRVGYGYGPEHVIAPIRDTRVRSEMGIMAYAGAAAALADEAHIVNSIEMVQEGREFYYKEFDRLGLKYLRSQAFFITVEDPPVPAQQIVDEALKQGVLLRHADVFDMPGYLRVSIGRPEDNKRVIEVLENIFQNG